jgi:heme-degrading monooxygenase HmoA
MRLVLAVMFAASSAFAQTPACDDAKNKALCEELLAIEKLDQSVRTAARADSQNLALLSEMNRTDRENLARVGAIIAKYGWPGKTLVGTAAAGTAWLVIQHSEAATQKTYLTMMAQAAEAGELDRGKVAMTLDHILVADGKPQRYGSAFKQVNGEIVPEPIEDEAGLDARRKAVGLPPFAEYSAQLVATYPRPAPQTKATTVVARIWRGRVRTSRADEYAQYLYDNGPVKIRAIPGNLGAEMLRRPEGDTTEFIVISYWPDRESIKAFAGADIQKARFLPRDREFLIDPDEFVRHYDVTSPP